MFGFKFGSKRFPYVERGEEYTSLRDGASASSDDGDSDEKNLFIGSLPRKKPSGRLWRFSVILLLLLTNVTTFIALFLTKHLSSNIDAVDPVYTPDSWARIDTLPTKFTRINWWTEYSDKNFTETDAAWDAINPAHGFIAMDRQWAKERHWPDSMHLPSDDSKNVYLLEAYHLIHCVTIIRKTFWEAIHRADHYTFNPPHAGHCIDMMRQYIMCKADNHPLYIFGDDTAGDEQYRKCNSWESLRQFATDHSACYRDTPLDVDPETFPLGAHFGYCDGGYDGLVEGERRGNWEHGAVG
ncbi:hypothetical protein FQN55_007782 [Onygenales sp. PD_40]|nr:hypothetical protein FQN55_007782 [Onygenales sp. PD_40]KAK2772302.1 hypothetical protein FQN53_004665 [Emmonsiellopsis sp. PD_33]KAK2781285.1 hypothetical protein FQN52_001719 [Onygenales sp. PD_12]KAK2797770.1 hypothetical protein FQN51_008223 [Onygenales sp. PD_10]